MPSRGHPPHHFSTSLKPDRWPARRLYEELYCARGETENRIKECQLDLFADRTSAASMRANQLRLWFYLLLGALRRIGLAHTRLATSTCGTIRLKLLKIGAQVRVSVRRIKIAMAFAYPYAHEFTLAHARIRVTPPDRKLPANHQPTPSQSARPVAAAEQALASKAQHRETISRQSQPSQFQQPP